MVSVDDLQIFTFPISVDFFSLFSRLDRGSWLLPLTLIPFVGPAIYLLVRPPIPTASSSVPSSIADEED